MAFNPAPTEVFASYASDGTTIEIDIADLPGLTAAEADATTGDLREVMLAFCNAFWQYYSALATADKPEAFVTTLPTLDRVLTGDFADNYKQTFNFSFYVPFNSTDVADEPA